MSVKLIFEDGSMRRFSIPTGTTPTIGLLEDFVRQLYSEARSITFVMRNTGSYLDSDEQLQAVIGDKVAPLVVKFTSEFPSSPKKEKAPSIPAKQAPPAYVAQEAPPVAPVGDLGMLAGLLPALLSSKALDVGSLLLPLLQSVPKEQLHVFLLGALSTAPVQQALAAAIVDHVHKNGAQSDEQAEIEEARQAELRVAAEERRRIEEEKERRKHEEERRAAEERDAERRAEAKAAEAEAARAEAEAAARQKADEEAWRKKEEKEREEREAEARRIAEEDAERELERERERERHEAMILAKAEEVAKLARLRAAEEKAAKEAAEAEAKAKAEADAKAAAKAAEDAMAEAKALAEAEAAAKAKAEAEAAAAKAKAEAQAQAQTANKTEPKVDARLLQLENMGFTDRARNVKLLVKHKGSLEMVIAELLQ